MATRPSSLIITVTPVVMGTAMAFGDGIAHWPTALVALLGGLMIHIGTNLTNDYYDLKRGADRIGDFDPMRGNLVGAVPLKAIGWGAVAAFGLLIPVTFYLIARAGWPVIMIAVISVLAGVFYTAGQRPLAYVGGFGDLFVLIFFGPVALAGTYYVQSLEINAAVVLAGLIPGLFAVCVLTINNIRDQETDGLSGKKTLVVRFGKRFGYFEFLGAFLSWAFVPALIFALIRDHVHILWASTVAYLGIPLVHKLLTAQQKPAYNQAIGQTIQLLLVYAVIFSIAWII